MIGRDQVELFPGPQRHVAHPLSATGVCGQPCDLRLGRDQLHRELRLAQLLRAPSPQRDHCQSDGHHERDRQADYANADRLPAPVQRRPRSHSTIRLNGLLLDAVASTEAASELAVVTPPRCSGVTGHSTTRRDCTERARLAVVGAWSAAVRTTPP